MENLAKGWFTSILGAAIMIMSIIEWWTTDNKMFYDFDVLGPFIAGFALLYMKDKISEWIGSFISSLLEKFKSK